ncbi:hypothetical protein ACI2IP_01555 [Microbacterium sp. NPDC090218]
MLDAEESKELRSLQARAYGRDAELTASDAARLRELEDRRFARVPDATPAVAVEPPVAEAAGEMQTEALAVEAGDAERSGDDRDSSGPAAAASEESSAASSRRALLSVMRAHWRPVAIAVVGLLVVGVGVGWLAFGRSDTASVALTAEQQEWQDDLVSGGVYDSGSIRALGVEEGAVIWAATRDGGERTCLILGTGDVTLPSCNLTERVSVEGIYGSITVRTEEDQERQVSAQMLLTVSGEPAAVVSSYEYDSMETGITYANEEESQTAERLVGEGYDAGSLWVVGYDGEVPIWTAVQRDSQSQCLIYDGSTDDAPVTCIEPETMQEQDASLVLNVVDTESGAVTHFEMASNNGPGYLVITREGDAAGAGED